MATNSKSQYYPSLDGLRAVSIIAVILFHANSIWLEGGFLGVESFFAISGFIITTLLWNDWRNTGKLDLLHFWQRRCRRLLPGIVTAVFTTAFVVAVFYPAELNQVREDILPGLTFTSNWFYILSDRSYFELIGRPRLLEHLWSLAVEFQYYLIWPLLCFVLFRCGKTACILFCLVGALIASGWMAWLFQPGADPSRIYFGTDTRISGLLLGSAAAFAMPLAHASLSFGKACLADIFGGMALIGLLLFFIYMDEMLPWLYQGGFACVALLTLLTIAVSIIHNEGIIAALLSWQPLRIIGVRAYNIYLWHWPVFCLSQPWVDVPLDGMDLLALRISIIAVLTEISYRWIDPAIRTGWLNKKIREIYRTGNMRQRITAAAGLASGGACATGFTALLFVGQGDFQQDASLSIAAEQAVLLGIPGEPPAAAEDRIGLDANAQDKQNDKSMQAVEGACSWEQGYLLAANPAYLPPHSPTNKLVQKDIPWSDIFASTGYNLEKRRIEPIATPNPFQWRHPAAQSKAVLSAALELGGDSDGMEEDDTCQFPSVHPANFKVTTKDTEKGSYIVRVYPAQDDKREVFAIGDSVMLGAASRLGQTIGDIDVDAQIGRQLTAGTALLAERKRKDLLGNTVVVHLGNNGPINSRQLTELLEVLKDTPRVVLVNLKVPRSFEAANNALLSEASADYPNVTVVDWHGPSLTANKVFAHDGLHLTGQGVRLYAKLISQTLCHTRL